MRHLQISGFDGFVLDQKHDDIQSSRTVLPIAYAVRLTFGPLSGFKNLLTAHVSHELHDGVEIGPLLAKRVDGLVVTGRRADRRPPLQTPLAGLPTLYVFSQTDDPEALCLLPDDFGGARLAVG